MLSVWTLCVFFVFFYSFTCVFVLCLCFSEKLAWRVLVIGLVVACCCCLCMGAGMNLLKLSVFCMIHKLQYMRIGDNPGSEVVLIAPCFDENRREYKCDVYVGCTYTVFWLACVFANSSGLLVVLRRAVGVVTCSETTIVLKKR